MRRLGRSQSRPGFCSDFTRVSFRFYTSTMGGSITDLQANIDFVMEVQKHPVLYNFELAEYTCKDVTDRTWNEIGKVVKMSGPACREKWKNLRIAFLRYEKARAKGMKRKPYYLTKSMQFIVPYLKPRAVNDKLSFLKRENDSFKNDTDDSDKSVTDDFEKSQDDTDFKVYMPQKRRNDEETSSKKKRLSDIDEHFVDVKEAGDLGEAEDSKEHMLTNLDDPVKSFMESLLPELYELNSGQFKIFKRRVLGLIDDITTNPSLGRESPPKLFIDC